MIKDSQLIDIVRNPSRQVTDDEMRIIMQKMAKEEH
jgi:trehalose-6-phosphatase